MKPPLTSSPVVCVSHGFQSHYERDFCNALAANGVAVTLLGSDRSDTAGLHAGVHFVNLRGSQDEARPRWRKAANLLRYHAALFICTAWRRRAVVHVMGLLAPLFLCGVLQGLWFRLLNRRYVLTVHDVLPHDSHTGWNRLLCGLAYRLPQRLVVHTERARDDIVRLFGIAPARVQVMEHGVAPAGSAGWPERPPRAAGAPVVILAFGTQAPYKGTDLLMEALLGVSFPFHLVVAGPCVDAAFQARFAAALAAYPQREHVRWMPGFVPDAEMQRLFAEADLIALPYRHIDQSGVLFQALRHGLPVLATRVGSLERYVTPEVGELSDGVTAPDVRAALGRWFARRGSLSATAIRQRAAAFEWPSTVRALQAVYS